MAVLDLHGMPDFPLSTRVARTTRLALVRLRTAVAEYRTRRILARLPDHLLEDIGMHRGQLR